MLSRSSIPKPGADHHEDEEEVSSEEISDYEDDEDEEEEQDDEDEDVKDEEDADEDAASDFSEEVPAAPTSALPPQPTSTTAPASEQVPEPEPPAEPEIDPLVAAEQAKEEGNVEFKLGHYSKSIDLYTKAHRKWPLLSSEALRSKLMCWFSLHLIGLNDKEPAYLTNRAAAYMQLKLYKSALEDCQIAASLQQANPQPKTLLRLARCQVAIGQPTQARTTLNNILAIDSNNTEALKLRQKANLLQDHLERYQKSAAAGEWVMARLALENAEALIDGSIPVEWRVWKIQIEIRRRRFDAATSAAT